MKRLFLFLFCCLLASWLSAQHHHATPGEPFAGLDTAFARVLKDWHAAGFAVAVVEKNKVVYSSGFGYKDYEKKTPVTPHTLFAIGSCTKAFTGSLIGLLVKEGKVDLDKPVRDYLPELKFYNETMNDNITLRDMMCHRTGLPRHDYSWYLFSTHSRDSLLRRIRYMEPTAGIRERWQYNNFMFFAQGVVVEKLSGKSWEDNVREKLFLPLGMKESVFSVTDLEKSGVDASLGYEVKKDSLIRKLDYYNIDAMGPAGSINSNVTDMANWVITWVNGGKFDGKEVIPGSYVNEAMSSQMVSGGAIPSKDAPDIFFSNYGFGWSLASYRGHYRVEHGGNIDGFSASTCFFPADSIGIVVLSNQNNSSVPAIVRNLVADRLLHLPYKDWSTYLKGTADKARKEAKDAQKAKVADQRAVAPATHPAADYTGIYSCPGYGSFEVMLQGDSLFGSFVSKTYWLRHDNYDVFSAFEKDPKEGIDTSGNGVKLQFNMDLSGTITDASIPLEPGLPKSIIFTRAPKAKALSVADLQKYTGEYVLGANLMVKVYIKDEKTLTLSVPGEQELELVPIDKDKFTLKGTNGYTIQFNSDDKGIVTELLSIQPNGTFKATRKK